MKKTVILILILIFLAGCTGHVVKEESIKIGVSIPLPDLALGLETTYKTA
jgi:hypothetical protein